MTTEKTSITDSISIFNSDIKRIEYVCGNTIIQLAKDKLYEEVILVEGIYKEWRLIDQDYSTNIIARFIPTDHGWDMARVCAKQTLFKTNREIRGNMILEEGSVFSMTFSNELERIVTIVRLPNELYVLIRSEVEVLGHSEVVHSVYQQHPVGAYRKISDIFEALDEQGHIAKYSQQDKDGCWRAVDTIHRL